MQNRIKINKKRNNKIEVKNMKFVKGVMIGGLITTGLVMMYADNDGMNKRKLMKKGKQFVKKIGIM